MISFAFGRGSQRLLDVLQKGIAVEQSLQAAALCKKYRIPFLSRYSSFVWNVM
jgi:hypothetical protein